MRNLIKLANGIVDLIVSLLWFEKSRKTGGKVSFVFGLIWFCLGGLWLLDTDWSKILWDEDADDEDVESGLSEVV